MIAGPAYSARPAKKKDGMLLRMLPALSFSAVFLLTVLAYTYMVTYGSGNLFLPESRGGAFDTLGESLLKGDATVAHDTIDAEAFIVDGKIYTYFGPMPGLIRILQNALFPAFYMKWSRLSCLIAAVLSLLFFAGFLRTSLKENASLSVSQKEALFFIAFLSFGFGTPLFFLVSCGYIYHEAILWGFAGCMSAMYFASRIFLRKDDGALVYLGYSVSLAVTFLSRATFALPWMMMGACFGFRMIYSLAAPVKESSGARKETKKNLTFVKLLCLSIPIGLSLAFYGWYNWKRFGSPFMFIDYQYYSIFQNNPGSVFISETGANNMRRLAAGFLNYFWPAGGHFSLRPPFIHMVPVHHINSDLYLIDYNEWVMAVPLAAPWLIAGSFAGAFVLFQDRRAAAEKIFILAFVPQYIIILTRYFITHRYSLDLYPLLFYLGMFFLAGFRFACPRDVKNTIRLFFFLGLISILINVLSTFSWTAYDNWGAYHEWREALKGRFSGIEDWMRNYGAFLFAAAFWRIF